MPMTSTATRASHTRRSPRCASSRRCPRSSRGSSGACTFEKQAPTVSYGEHADDLFTTLRRAPDAEQSDQVLVLTRKGQNTLEPAGTWDPLGMRGTCSPGYVIRAEFLGEQILPA